tara:strand:- start:466 stop:603 length:138 start_codon:yes stop_codon:yes gene_type:complete
MKEAASFFNLKSHTSICGVISGKNNYAGKYEEGTPVKWKYFNSRS